MRRRIGKHLGCRQNHYNGSRRNVVVVTLTFVLATFVLIIILQQQVDGFSYHQRQPTTTTNSSRSSRHHRPSLSLLPKDLVFHHIQSSGHPTGKSIRAPYYWHSSTTTTTTTTPEHSLSKLWRSAKNDLPESGHVSKLHDYVALLRPKAAAQAMGSWVAGRLIVLKGTSSSIWQLHYWSQEVLAICLVFLSYGTGMVWNDCADATIDQTDVIDNMKDDDTKSQSSKKSQRPIASGRVSAKEGLIYSAVLTIATLLLANLGISRQFTIWCSINLAIMLAYSFEGLQTILLCKNLVVGFLGISPLWGAMTMPTISTTVDVATKKVISIAIVQQRIRLLSATGCAVAVAREILKDVQDVDMDRGTKTTLPLVVGANAATRMAFALLAGVLATLLTPSCRQLFLRDAITATLPWLAPTIYGSSWILAAATTIKAWSLTDILSQQKRVRHTIYILLGGLIATILTQ